MTAATLFAWWFEDNHKYRPDQNAFRPYLDTKDGLGILVDEALHVSPYSYLVRTVMVTHIAKVYNNANHETIPRSKDTIGLPLQVKKIVQSFVPRRTFSIHAEREEFGYFTSNRGVLRLPYGNVIIHYGLLACSVKTTGR